MAEEISNHDLKVAETLGAHTAMLAEIRKNTACLPRLTQKVDRHDHQLRNYRWIGRATLLAVIGLIADWCRVHFFGGK